MALNTEERPWGQITVIDEGDGFKVKRITILSGRRLSYQYHNHRGEHWFVVAGTLAVTLDGQEFSLEAGQHIDIPLGAKHRMGNNATAPVTLIEVQRGTVLDENDIVRLEDDFGRK